MPYKVAKRISDCITFTLKLQGRSKELIKDDDSKEYLLNYLDNVDKEYEKFKKENLANYKKFDVRREEA